MALYCSETQWRQPLVVNHLEKIAMVHDLVKNSAQRALIVAAESCRESDYRSHYWYCWALLVTDRDRCIIIKYWAGWPHFGVEARQDRAIGISSGVVCLVDLSVGTHDNAFELTWVVLIYA